MRGTRSRSEGGRDRGTTPALTYVLAIGVVTLLISGLLITTTDFVDGERERVVRDELEIVGERLAADAAAVDHLAGDGATATQRTTVPETVADTGYYVDIVGCPSGSVCLALTDADPSIDVNVTVPLDNQSAVTISRASPGTVRIDAVPRAGLSTVADADRGVSPTIGIARNVSPGLGSSGELFEADTAPVVSGISYSPAPPTPGDPTTFQSNVTTFLGGNYTYRWDLNGDGTVDRTGNATDAETVSYTYATPGRYNASLEVVGPNNQSDTVSQLVRVSGLVRADPNVSASSENTDASGPTAGFALRLRNNFASDSVTITDVAIDPADPSVERLYNPSGPEVAVESGGYDDSPVEIYENGTLVPFEVGSQSVSPTGTSTLRIGEFYDSTFLVDSNQYETSGQTFDVSVRYETGSNENYVSRFTVTPDSTGAPGPATGADRPRIDSLDTTCSPSAYAGYTRVDVKLEVSDPVGDGDDLNYVYVRLTDKSGNVEDDSYDGAGGDSDSLTLTFFVPDGDVGDLDDARAVVYDDSGSSATGTKEACT